MAGVFDFGDHYLKVKQFEADQKRLAERDAWEREDRASRQAKQRKVDEAVNRVRGMSTDGVVEQGAGDLTAGGIQHVLANGYGATTGTAAVQELAGDSYREMQRGMRAPGAPAQPAPTAPVLGLAQNGPVTRKARESEIMGAAGDALLAAGDMSGWVGMRDKAKSARYSEGLAQGYKQFDQLHSSGQLSSFLDELNQNGGVRGGFSTMKYTVGEGKDAKQVEYLVYDPEGKGAPTRVDLDDARQIFAIRSLMDVDPERAQAELRALKGEQRKLAMQMLDIQFKGAGLRNDVTKSVHSADMDVKGQALRERTFEEDSKLRRQGLSLQREGLGLRRQEMESQDWMPIGATEDDRGLTFFNRRTAAVESRRLPQGQSGKDLFARITGSRPQAGTKVHDGGIIQRGEQLFAPGPDGKYAELKLGPSALDLAMKADREEPAGGLNPGPKGLTPFTREDLAPPDTTRMQREAKRGLLGGITYVYRDPNTGKAYSLQEYNRLIERGY